MAALTRRGVPARWAGPGALAVALAAFLAVAAAAAGADPAGRSPEYDVKAAFLFRFAQFVEWPARAFPTADAPFTFCVLGDDPFGAALDATLRGETIRGRSLAVHRAVDVDDLDACHLVFVSRSEAERVDAVLAALAGRPVLAVSEIDGFAERGGTIAFYLDDRRIRFAINPASAERANLTVSSELLRLGRIVRNGERT